MKDERPDASLLIGLHKLAETNGEGLVPELHDIWAREQGRGDEAGNILPFRPKPSAGASIESRNRTGLLLPFKR